MRAADDNEPLTREWFREQNVTLTTNTDGTFAVSDLGMIPIEIPGPQPARTRGEFRAALAEREQKSGE